MRANSRHTTSILTQPTVLEMKPIGSPVEVLLLGLVHGEHAVHVLVRLDAQVQLLPLHRPGTVLPIIQALTSSSLGLLLAGVLALLVVALVVGVVRLLLLRVGLELVDCSRRCLGVAGFSHSAA